MKNIAEIGDWERLQGQKALNSREFLAGVEKFVDKAKLKRTYPRGKIISSARIGLRSIKIAHDYDANIWSVKVFGKEIDPLLRKYVYNMIVPAVSSYLEECKEKKRQAEIRKKCEREIRIERRKLSVSNRAMAELVKVTKTL